MLIRSITFFANQTLMIDDAAVARAGEFLTEARESFEAAGFGVQTVRMTLQPLPRTLQPSDFISLAKTFEANCLSHGIEFCSVGPVQTGSNLTQAIPDVLACTTTLFTSARIADCSHEISPAAIAMSADVTLRNSTISDDGFGNLRFAALANCQPRVPFLPAAYHEGDDCGFAIATESADLAVSAFQQARTTQEGRDNLRSSIEQHAKRIEVVADDLASASGFQFYGSDFSLAPFPDQARSIGGALESLGCGELGSHGSVAAAAFITETIEQAQFNRTGFCGLFLPVLEDTVLAQRAHAGTLGINDLLLMSAVCGTGLDTVPLAGDVEVQVIAGILWDIATMAVRLDKPLTARLMPLPGKLSGDPVVFDFPFFADGGVMPHRAGFFKTPSDSDPPLSLQPKSSRRN